MAARKRIDNTKHKLHKSEFVQERRSSGDILPQIFRPAAMRREAAPQLASWRLSQFGQQRSLAIENFLEKATRLYEQEKGKPDGFPLLGLYVERQLRWSTVGLPEAGAKASANLYSLIETAKAYGFEPYRYLRMIFTELPKASSLEDIGALLPLKKTLAYDEAA